MKKRIISLFLAITMILGVCLGAVSCNNGSDPTEPPTDAPTEAPTQSPTGNPDDNDDDYTLEKQDGHNQLTFYWVTSGSIENCDIWIWWGDKDGAGHIMHKWKHGGKVIVNVPEDITEVGFIVRTGCSDPGGTSWGEATKDGTQEDRFALIKGEDTVIYLKSGDASQYTSNDGGETLEMITEFSLAGMIDFNRIQYFISPKVKFSNKDDFKVYEGDKQLTVVKVNTIGTEASTGIIEVAETLDLSKNYTVSIKDYGEKAVVPTGIFDSNYFIENYTYDGNDLGATINSDGTTTFKVWAPTASKVVLNLFASGHEGEAYNNIDMTLGDKGVWSYTAECGHGTYYTYSVTTSVGTQEAVDPYAKTAGLNGNRGMVVDLSLTNPEGWDSDAAFSTGIDSYSDAIIWEVHVRDFSNKIASSQYKGKYLAFTERGLVNEHGQSVGIDYLVELGITHVHLLPVYDYATVNEADPDSQFNWGYDPKNYNVPEGSYSTNPYDGAVRIEEYKKMVMALHEAGIGVIMDVVYNHTYTANSYLNKIVPYYYYRYTSNGTNSSASGCGNDTASERYMYGKYMVDSVSYWLEEYNLDGFRFDLMGLHDLDTMQEVESAVHTIDPQALIYGEGWTMGDTIDGSLMANQSQINKITATNDAIGRIAVFNDTIRDGLKGSVFSATGKGYISGAGKTNLNAVLLGIKGTGGSSWSVDDAMVVNYMSAHDNNTLWDKLELSNGSDSVETRLAMNRLGATILMVSKGMVFFQAGEEMLRTKDGDENSYNSSDEINNIDWSVLNAGTNEYEMMLYYKGLIEIRKNFGLFTDNSVPVSTTILSDGAVAVTFIRESEIATIILNPTDEAITYTLDDGSWNMICDGQHAGIEVIDTVEGEISIPAYSAVIVVNDSIFNG